MYINRNDEDRDRLDMTIDGEDEDGVDCSAQNNELYSSSMSRAETQLLLWVDCHSHCYCYYQYPVILDC